MVQKFFFQNSVGYKCDVCQRSIKVPENRFSVDLISRCIITQGCQGKMRKLFTFKETNNAPIIPPSVAGLDDWLQRKILYTHQQTIKTTTWLIEHNLGSKPTVQVQVERTDPENPNATILVDILPLKVEILDLNTIRLTFEKNESGVAQCIGTAAGITYTKTIELTGEPVQITNRGVLTFATLNSSAAIPITGVFSNNISTEINYTGVTVYLDTHSPWFGTTKLFINGKIYTVRTMNIKTTPPAPAYFGAGLIEDGSLFNIKDVNSVGEILIIFAKPPYGTFDRIVNQYIDVASINSNLSEIYFSKGELFAQPSIIKQIYPHIIEVN